MHQIPYIFSRLNAIYASKVALSGGSIAGLLYLTSQSPSAMRESPSDASKYVNPKDVAKFVSKDAFEVYRRDGIVVIDNVLTDKELFLVRKEVNEALDNRNRNRNRNRQHRNISNNGYSINSNSNRINNGSINCSCNNNNNNNNNNSSSSSSCCCCYYYNILIIAVIALRIRHLSPCHNIFMLIYL